MDVDELPMDVDDALDADEVLSARATAPDRDSVNVVARSSAVFRNFFIQKSASEVDATLHYGKA